jgi:hypothetical protein
MLDLLAAAQSVQAENPEGLPSGFSFYRMFKFSKALKRDEEHSERHEKLPLKPGPFV